LVTPATLQGELEHVAVAALPTRGVSVTLTLAAPLGRLKLTETVLVPDAVVLALPSVAMFDDSEGKENHGRDWE